MAPSKTSGAAPVTVVAPRVPEMVRAAIVSVLANFADVIWLSPMSAVAIVASASLQFKFHDHFIMEKFLSYYQYVAKCITVNLYYHSTGDK